MKKASSRLLVSAAFFAVWLCASGLAFYLKRSQLLIGFDGGYVFNLAQRQIEWHVPLLSTSMDWLQGLGDIFFAFNARLLPAFIAASFTTDTDIAKVVIYDVVLCELSIAIVIFAVSLGVSRIVAIAAALLTCLLFLPFYRPTLIYGMLAIVPQDGSLIAAALLTGAAFLQFGRRNWLTDLPFALAVICLLAWSVLVSITYMILSAPFLLLCAISGTIAAASRAERSCKIGLFAAVALFLAAGPAIYLASTTLDSAAVVFPSELENSLATFFFASILFHWKSLGPAIVIFGIAGALIAAGDRTRPTLRIFAITLLTYLCSRLTFAVLTIIFDFWRGPAPLYFEFFVIPLYAIFAARFGAYALDWAWRRLGFAAPAGVIAEGGLVGAASVAVLALAIGTASPDHGFPYPPRSTLITDLLVQETGLRPGSIFRGRTADMIGQSIGRDIDWFDLHGGDGALATEIGNEMRVVGLHYFGIPGLFQYTPTISPFFYATTSRLLALPGDKQLRNVMVLRDFNPRILAMLGVRFVITDHSYDGRATLRTTEATKDRSLFLYEIANPNLGDYSPTVVNKIATATAIVARMQDDSFDPAREIIADVPAGDTTELVPARSTRFTFLGASLRIEAESTGRSILLLPLEFNRCLSARGADQQHPLLFRANLLETGILFSGRIDATLSIRTGPFLNPACRLRDLLDARALGVGAVPRRAPLPNASN